MNAYLIVFNTGEVTRQQLLDHIDKRKEIVNWYAYWSNGVFVATEKNARFIEQMIHRQFPHLTFLVTKVASNDAFETSGWLEPDLWDFINEPGPAPSKSTKRSSE